MRKKLVCKIKIGRGTEKSCTKKLDTIDLEASTLLN